MCQVPTSLAGLLSLLAPCFTQPTFQTFSMLLVGFVGRIRDCTVTGMLQAAGLAGVWHHSRAHDFFARRRWDPDRLGLALLDFLVTVFVKPGVAIRLAVDDTLFGRSGKRVWGAHYLHDGAQPEGSGRRTRWGNCWVVVVLVVSLPCLGDRAVALPVLFRLFRPKDDAHPNRPSQPALARTLIDMVLRRFPGRTVELVMDGAYASQAWRGLPARVTVTTRMRANAALHKPAPARRSGQQGRPPLKGAKLPPLAEIANTATFTTVTVTGPDGRQRTEHVHEFVCLWYTPFYTRPVKVILIRNPGTSEGVDVAIASTDVATSPQPSCSPATTAAGRSRPPTNKPKPTAPARPATASSTPSSEPSRSGSSARPSRSPGTSSTATPTPTSTPAAATPPGTAKRQPSATPTCSPRCAAS